MSRDANSVNRARRPGRDLLIGAALYLVAVTAIVVQIGHRPAFAYNWENYTLWNGFNWWAAPSLNAFDLTDGLMTDSGRSWWVLGPIWVAFRFFDPALEPMRIATGVIAALSAPLTWLLARRLLPGMLRIPDWSHLERSTVQRATGWAALMAGLLLPLLASWLLYARTATLVGLSVTPAVATILLIDQVRRLERHWWAWLIALQVMLLLGAWAYAPIRFLYPMAIVFFGVEALFRRDRSRQWLIVMVVSVMTLPLLLASVDQYPEWNPLDSIQRYYNARGEQVLALREDPGNYQYFLRGADPELSTEELERQLIEQNARDLIRLFFDIETKPVLTDYWNQMGRWIPWFMAPLVILGMVVSLMPVFRSPESRLLHLTFWGFTLPMILTSKVHIGRLVFAIPMLCIFAAIGVIGIAWGLTFHVDRSGKRRPLLHAAAPILGLALIVPTAVTSLEDYRVPVPAGWESRLAALLQGDPERFAGGVVFIGGGSDQQMVEEISLAAVRIEIDGDYQFVNLARGETPDPGDSRPAVYFGAVAEQLENDAIAAELCGLPWVIRESTDPLAEVDIPCSSADVVRLS